MQYKSKGEDKNSHYTGVFCSRVAKGWPVCRTQDRAYPAIISLEPRTSYSRTFNTGMGSVLYNCHFSTRHGTCPAKLSCHSQRDQCTPLMHWTGISGFLVVSMHIHRGKRRSELATGISTNKASGTDGFSATQAPFGTEFPFTPLVQAFPKATFPPLCRHTFFMQELHHPVHIHLFSFRCYPVMQAFFHHRWYPGL